MNVNAYNLLILIGAVHGLVMSGLLFLSGRNRRSSNILLALLLLFYTLPVLRSTLIDLGFFSAYGYSFLSIELLYGLGPSLYLYVKTVADPKYEISKVDFLHFLPVALELIYYVSPYYPQQRLHFFGSAVNSVHFIWMIEQIGAIISILAYLALTNRLLWRYSAWVKRNFSDTGRRTLRWLQTPVLLYSVFFVLWISLRVIDVVEFNDSLGIEPYYPFLIFLSFSTYWIGTKGYLEEQVESAGFSREKPTRQHDPSNGATIAAMFADLETLIDREQLFLNSDLSLPQLAERMGVNPRVLSNAINTGAGVNFYEFINGYRVEEFQRRVAQDAEGASLLSLAHDCGFGSKATFNHVFKKKTGMTPSQYRNDAAARRGAENQEQE